MAYCVSCGAYIPDEQTRCLACGYDEAQAAREKAKKENKSGYSSGSAYASSSSSVHDQLNRQRLEREEMRSRLDEQRKAQQANNRQWAEQEYARRRQEKQDASESYEAWAGSAGSNDKKHSNSKMFSIISYLGPLCFLTRLVCPEDEFASFHAKQGLKLFICSVLVNIFGRLTGVGWLLNAFTIYCMVKGISSANQGRKDKLPIIGTWFEN